MAHDKAVAEAEAERLRTDPHGLAPRLAALEADLELGVPSGATAAQRVLAIAADLSLLTVISDHKTEDAVAFLEKDLGIDGGGGGCCGGSVA